MKAKLKIKGRELIIENLSKATGLRKIFGLMFRTKNTGALLFKLEKGKRAIHSLFCPLFLAIWLCEGKLVDCKLIKPWRFSVDCGKEFDKLIEIPFNERYAPIVNFFLTLSLSDEGKI